MPAHPPREEEVIEPEGLEEGMKKMGEEVTEILEHIPGKLYVRRIIRPK
ncbi:MAG: IS66 family transposase zinc-finger binding domain-containing protein [Bacteroidota bacterium]